MATLEEIIRELKRGRAKKTFVEAGLTAFHEELLSGLPYHIIQSLIDVIISCKYTAPYTVRFIDCLIPQGKLEKEEVDKIMLWILSNYNKKPVSIINKLLHWLTGIVEFGIADKQLVDDYYELIYGMIFNSKLEKSVCHLVYILTRPEDVYRGRVDTLQSLHKKNRQARYTTAVLCLFKSYKPEYVPESFPVINIQGAFKKFSPAVENNFKLAQERILRKDIDASTHKKYIQWGRPFLKQESRLVPDAVYIHLGADLYNEKKKKVIQFLEKISLLKSQNFVEMPSQVLSMLLNDAGILLLATNQNVHVRFSYVVYYTLRRAFLEVDAKIPSKECEYFLKQLGDLEECVQGGIPVVNQFLTEYICTWDGLEYRAHIYRLIGYMSFKTFREWEQLVLTYLDTLFITGSVEVKSLIIHTLQWVIIYMLTPKMYKSHKKQPELFLGMETLTEDEARIILPEFVNYFGQMCQKGLQMTDSHPLILHSCITFYFLVSDVENTETSWSVLPRACVYRCLVGDSTSMLSRTSQLLLKYWETYESKRNRIRRQWFNEIEMLTEYSSDVFNCLVADKAITKRDRGYIFANLQDKHKIKFGQGDKAFSVVHSLPMIVLLRHKSRTFSEEDIITVLRASFPGLFNYLDLLHDKYSNAE